MNQCQLPENPSQTTPPGLSRAWIWWRSTTHAALSISVRGFAVGLFAVLIALATESTDAETAGGLLLLLFVIGLLMGAFCGSIVGIVASYSLSKATDVGLGCGLGILKMAALALLVGIVRGLGSDDFPAVCALGLVFGPVLGLLSGGFASSAREGLWLGLRADQQEPDAESVDTTTPPSNEDGSADE